MKAITIWQPYAQAILLGLKHYETRTWKTDYRGDLIIHSSLRPLSPDRKQLSAKYNIVEMPRGSFLVLCELEECLLITKNLIEKQNRIELDFGNWIIGNYAWKLKIKNICKNNKDIPGNQGLWNVDVGIINNYLIKS